MDVPVLHDGLGGLAPSVYLRSVDSFLQNRTSIKLGELGESFALRNFTAVDTEMKDLASTNPKSTEEASCEEIKILRMFTLAKDDRDVATIGPNRKRRIDLNFCHLAAKAVKYDQVREFAFTSFRTADGVECFDETVKVIEEHGGVWCAARLISSYKAQSNRSRQMMEPDLLHQRKDQGFRGIPAKFHKFQKILGEKLNAKGFSESEEWAEESTGNSGVAMSLSSTISNAEPYTSSVPSLSQAVLMKEEYIELEKECANVRDVGRVQNHVNPIFCSKELNVILENESKQLRSQFAGRASYSSTLPFHQLAMGSALVGDLKCKGGRLQHPVLDVSLEDDIIDERKVSQTKASPSTSALLNWNEVGLCARRHCVQSSLSLLTTVDLESAINAVLAVQNQDISIPNSKVGIRIQPSICESQPLLHPESFISRKVIGPTLSGSDVSSDHTNTPDIASRSLTTVSKVRVAEPASVTEATIPLDFEGMIHASRTKPQKWLSERSPNERSRRNKSAPLLERSNSIRTLAENPEGSIVPVKGCDLAHRSNLKVVSFEKSTDSQFPKSAEGYVWQSYIVVSPSAGGDEASDVVIERLYDNDLLLFRCLESSRVIKILAHSDRWTEKSSKILETILQTDIKLRKNFKMISHTWKVAVKEVEDLYVVMLLRSQERAASQILVPANVWHDVKRNGNCILTLVQIYEKGVRDFFCDFLNNEDIATRVAQDTVQLLELEVAIDHLYKTQVGECHHLTEEQIVKLGESACKEKFIDSPGLHCKVGLRGLGMLGKRVLVASSKLRGTPSSSVGCQQHGKEERRKAGPSVSVPAVLHDNVSTVVSESDVSATVGSPPPITPSVSVPDIIIPGATIANWNTKKNAVGLHSFRSPKVPVKFINGKTANLGVQGKTSLISIEQASIWDSGFTSMASPSRAPKISASDSRTKRAVPSLPSVSMTVNTSGLTDRFAACEPHLLTRNIHSLHGGFQDTSDDSVAKPPVITLCKNIPYFSTGTGLQAELDTGFRRLDIHSKQERTVFETCNASKSESNRVSQDRLRNSILGSGARATTLFAVRACSPMVVSDKSLPHRAASDMGMLFSSPTIDTISVEPVANNCLRGNYESSHLAEASAPGQHGRKSFTYTPCGIDSMQRLFDEKQSAVKARKQFRGQCIQGLTTLPLQFVQNETGSTCLGKASRLRIAVPKSMATKSLPVHCLLMRPIITGGARAVGPVGRKGKVLATVGCDPDTTPRRRIVSFSGRGTRNTSNLSAVKSNKILSKLTSFSAQFNHNVCTVTCPVTTAYVTWSNTRNLPILCSGKSRQIGSSTPTEIQNDAKIINIPLGSSSPAIIPQVTGKATRCVNMLSSPGAPSEPVARDSGLGHQSPSYLPSTVASEVATIKRVMASTTISSIGRSHTCRNKAQDCPNDMRPNFTSKISSTTHSVLCVDAVPPPQAAQIISFPLGIHSGSGPACLRLMRTGHLDMTAISEQAGNVPKPSDIQNIWGREAGKIQAKPVPACACQSMTRVALEQVGTQMRSDPVVSKAGVSLSCSQRSDPAVSKAGVSLSDRHGHVMTRAPQCTNQSLVTAVLEHVNSSLDQPGLSESRKPVPREYVHRQAKVRAPIRTIDAQNKIHIKWSSVWSSNTHILAANDPARLFVKSACNTSEQPVLHSPYKPNWLCSSPVGSNMETRCQKIATFHVGSVGVTAEKQLPSPMNVIQEHSCGPTFQKSTKLTDYQVVPSHQTVGIPMLASDTGCLEEEGKREHSIVDDAVELRGNPSTLSSQVQEKTSRCNFGFLDEELTKLIGPKLCQGYVCAQRSLLPASSSPTKSMAAATTTCSNGKHNLATSTILVGSCAGAGLNVGCRAKLSPYSRTDTRSVYGVSLPNQSLLQSTTSPSHSFRPFSENLRFGKYDIELTPRRIKTVNVQDFVAGSSTDFQPLPGNLQRGRSCLRARISRKTAVKLLRNYGAGGSKLKLKVWNKSGMTGPRLLAAVHRTVRATTAKDSKLRVIMKKEAAKEIMRHIDQPHDHFKVKVANHLGVSGRHLFKAIYRAISLRCGRKMLDFNSPTRISGRALETGSISGLMAQKGVCPEISLCGREDGGSPGRAKELSSDRHSEELRNLVGVAKCSTKFCRESVESVDGEFRNIFDDILTCVSVADSDETK